VGIYTQNLCEPVSIVLAHPVYVLLSRRSWSRWRHTGDLYQRAVGTEHSKQRAVTGSFTVRSHVCAVREWSTSC